MNFVCAFELCLNIGYCSITSQWILLTLTQNQIYSVEMFFTTEFTHMYNYTMNIVPSNEKTQLLLISEANI